MDLFLSTWVLLVAGLLFALPMIYMRVRDHTSFEDETLYAILLLLRSNPNLLFVQGTHG